MRLVHFGVGLPADLGFEPVADSEWWTLTLAVPAGIAPRVQAQVADSFGTHLVEDPLNPTTARHPFGANSVCEAAGYVEPEWAHPRPGAPPGAWATWCSTARRSAAGPARPSTYPVGFDDRAGDARYPLLVVHDGGDYLHYASIADGARQPDPPRRHAADRGGASAPGRAPRRVRRRSAVTPATSPTSSCRGSRPSFRWPPRPAGARVMGASFGAVASLSAATPRSGHASAGCCCSPARSPAPAPAAGRARSALWQPVRRWSAGSSPTAEPVAERVFVSLRRVRVADLREPRLRAGARRTGMEVRFVESRDGHNWAAWRDGLGEASAVPVPRDRRRWSTCRREPCYLSHVADVTRRIGLSLGADLCWPICYEEVLERLDLALPVERRHRALRRRAGDDRAVRPAPADAATTSSSTA